MALAQEKKGGPYTKDEKRKRRDEVFKLQFEYGYSATYISKMMKINRNTINRDLSFLYSRLKEDLANEDIDSWLNKQFARLESQRARLRKELDNDITLQDKLHVERMILIVDSKISSLLMKLTSTRDEGRAMGIQFINKWMKDHGQTDTYMSYDSLCRLTKENREKILKILDGK